MLYLQCGNDLKCCGNTVCLSAYGHVEPSDFVCAEGTLGTLAENTLTLTEAGQTTYQAWLARIKSK